MRAVDGGLFEVASGDSAECTRRTIERLRHFSLTGLNRAPAQLRKIRRHTHPTAQVHETHPHSFAIEGLSWSASQTAFAVRIPERAAHPPWRKPAAQALLDLRHRALTAPARRRLAAVGSGCAVHSRSVTRRCEPLAGGSSQHRRLAVIVTRSTPRPWDVDGSSRCQPHRFVPDSRGSSPCYHDGLLSAISLRLSVRHVAVAALQG